MMKLKPKSTELNNVDHFKKKIGFDNTKMLMKRADVEITSTKFANVFDKQTIVEPVISEKEPVKSSYHKEIRKTQSIILIFLFRYLLLISV
jgi:hypothetical protein